MKEFTKTVRFSVFSNYKVKIICTDDVKGSWKKRFPEADDSITEGAAALTTPFSGGHTSMFFGLNAGAGIIAHECWHVVNALFTWAGVKDYEDEITAYHLGWLVRQVTIFLLASEPKFNATQPASEEGQCQTQNQPPQSKTPRKLQLKHLTPQSDNSSETKSETKKSRRTRSSSCSRNTA